MTEDNQYMNQISRNTTGENQTMEDAENVVLIVVDCLREDFLSQDIASC